MLTKRQLQAKRQLLNESLDELFALFALFALCIDEECKLADKRFALRMAHEKHSLLQKMIQCVFTDCLRVIAARERKEELEQSITTEREDTS